MDRQPSQEVFDNIKEQSIKVWQTNYSDEFGYVTEKVDRINQITNFKDNWSSIIGMFDDTNKQRLFYQLQRESISFLYKMKGSYSIFLPYVLIRDVLHEY